MNYSRLFVSITGAALCTQDLRIETSDRVARSIEQVRSGCVVESLSEEQIRADSETVAVLLDGFADDGLRRVGQRNGLGAGRLHRVVHGQPDESQMPTGKYCPGG